MKPGKLRSPIKAIHEALASVRLAVGNPLCIQPAKTESFRDLLTSFSSVYYTAPVTSSPPSSDSSCSLGSVCHQQFPVDIHVVSFREEVEEEVVSAAASTSNCSSCLSSSSVTGDPDNPDEAEELPKGAINPTRFFFSPCTSKLITGESFLDVGLSSCDPILGPKEAEEAKKEDEAFDVSSKTTDVETVLEEVAMSKETCKHGIPVALASRDPYRDFRNSMDEMVAAHRLWDWLGLQELLCCYLRLNERKTHKLIVLAFTDLLVHLASQGRIRKSIVRDTFSTSPLPSAHDAPQLLHRFLSDEYYCGSSSSFSSSCSS